MRHAVDLVENGKQGVNDNRPIRLPLFRPKSRHSGTVPPFIACMVRLTPTRPFRIRASLTPLLSALPSRGGGAPTKRSEEHTSELQSLMRISYAVLCLKKKHNTVSTHLH